MASRDTTSRRRFDEGRILLRLEKTIPADVAKITPVVEEVMTAVGRIGCAAGKEFEIETSLREALANAIRHGCRHDKKKQVQFVVECDGSRGVRIVVRDPGPGFDPAALPSPIQGREIHNTHGRGIYLINLLMDDVRFERGGTEIVMRKK